MIRQDVLFRLESEYVGNPHHVSGNAILHALAHEDRIDYDEQRALRVSHGVFCPSVYGVFPDWHSKSGGRMHFASTLKPIEAYADLFLFRRGAHHWIHDGRARDAVNTPAFRRHNDLHALETHQTIPLGGESPRKSQWYIHAYLTQDDAADVLPLEPDRLDGLHLGGSRNYGFGEVSVKDTATTDLRDLDYDAIATADGHVLELVTPYVLESEYPKATDREPPVWWDDIPLRTRRDAIVEQRDRHELRTVDHGQVVGYDGDRPVDTARNGVARIGTHSKYGYGELLVRPAEVRE